MSIEVTPADIAAAVAVARAASEKALAACGQAELRKRIESSMLYDDTDEAEHAEHLEAFKHDLYVYSLYRMRITGKYLGAFLAFNAAAKHGFNYNMLGWMQEGAPADIEACMQEQGWFLE